MNTKIIFISLFMVFGIMAIAQQTVILSNKLNVDRNDELVVLKRNQLTTLFKGNKQQLLQVKCGDSIINEIQYIDNDGDGVWDDALLLYSFKLNNPLGQPYQWHSEFLDDHPKGHVEPWLHLLDRFGNSVVPFCWQISFHQPQ